MPRGRMGGRHGMSTEKAKDFKGTMKKLMGYLTQYKIGLLLVVIFAIGSTIFNIAGPKILGKATTPCRRPRPRLPAGRHLPQHRVRGWPPREAHRKADGDRESVNLSIPISIHNIRRVYYDPYDR